MQPADMSLLNSAGRIVFIVRSGFIALIGTTIAWSSPLLAHPGYEHAVPLPGEDILIVLAALALIAISIPGVAIISRKLKHGLHDEKPRVRK